MFGTLACVFFVVAMTTYFLRLWCLWAIESKSPELFNQLGKPPPVGPGSWSFLYRASRYAAFAQLSKAVRYAVWVARMLDFLTFALMIAYAINLSQQPGWRKMWEGKAVYQYSDKRKG